MNINPEPYKVIKKTGVEITAQRNNGHKITRNVSHFKKIKNPEDVDDECSDYSESVPTQTQARNNHQADRKRTTRTIWTRISIEFNWISWDHLQTFLLSLSGD